MFLVPRCYHDDSFPRLSSEHLGSLMVLIIKSPGIIVPFHLSLKIALVTKVLISSVDNMAIEL